MHQVFAEFDEIASFQLQKIITLSREWFGLDMDKGESFTVNASLLNYLSAISVIGIVSGIVMLM